MKQCEGEGQGSCYGCYIKKGFWNRIWMCFLYHLDNDNGHIYCYECAKEIEEKN